MLPAPPGDGAGMSMEVWLQPDYTWKTGSVLTIYGSSISRQFRVEQDYSDLVLQLGELDERRADPRRTLRVADVFRRRQFLLTVTSSEQETLIYVDGHLAARSSEFLISTQDMSGRLIVANSPLRDHSWSGKIKGLAIYKGVASPSQVRNGYQNWEERDTPSPESADKSVALYLFRERAGSVVHDASSSRADLEIPQRFLVVDQLRFEDPVTEFRTQDTYAKNILLNVAGFVPLGFMLRLWFGGVRRIKRATVYAVLVGFTVSFVIELLQSFLPTRYSGCTDLLTNTLGTWIGTMLCERLHSMAAVRIEAS